MDKTQTRINDWYASLTPRPRPRLRLFLFPYAGGGAASYLPWVPHFPAEVELVVAQLPGRGTRFTQPPLRSLKPALDGALAAMLPLLNRPFALVGYSMGSLLAFELARALESMGHRPELLAVGAYPAPHMPRPGEPLHQLPDAEFIAELKRLEGMPAEVLDSPELLELVLPAIRADFEVVETSSYRQGPALSVPLLAFGGSEDSEAPPGHIEGWRELTRADCSVTIFQGGHFFINRYLSEVAGIVRGNLMRTLQAEPA